MAPPPPPPPNRLSFHLRKVIAERLALVCETTGEHLEDVARFGVFLAVLFFEEKMKGNTLVIRDADGSVRELPTDVSPYMGNRCLLPGEKACRLNLTHSNYISLDMDFNEFVESFNAALDHLTGELYLRCFHEPVVVCVLQSSVTAPDTSEP